MTDQLTELAHVRLAKDETAWICTLRPDRSPHITPVWFVFQPDFCWVCCTELSIKAVNVAADPRVSIALGDGELPIVAEGLARVRPQTDFPSDIRTAFAEKYAGWDIMTLEQDRWRRVLLEIPVTRWLLAGTPK